MWVWWREGGAREGVIDEEMGKWIMDWACSQPVSQSVTQKGQFHRSKNLSELTSLTQPVIPRACHPPPHPHRACMRVMPFSHYALQPQQCNCLGLVRPTWSVYFMLQTENCCGPRGGQRTNRTTVTLQHTGRCSAGQPAVPQHGADSFWATPDFM